MACTTESKFVEQLRFLASGQDDPQSAALTKAADEIGHLLSALKAMSELFKATEASAQFALSEVERLREENQELKLQYLSDQGQWIEETGRLREALHKVLGIVGNVPVDRFEYNVIKEARAALGEKE